MNAELKVRNVVAQICVLVRDHTELIQCKKKAAAGRDNFHFLLKQQIKWIVFSSALSTPFVSRLCHRGYTISL